MHPYTGNYIEHIDSTTNNFKYYTFAPRPLMNGNMYQMDDELATLLTEAHRNIGFLEGLIQFAPNRGPFTELILLKECTYSRMIDYTGPNFKDVLTICGTGKGDISPIMNLKSAYRTAMTMEIPSTKQAHIIVSFLTAQLFEHVLNFTKTYFCKKAYYIGLLQLLSLRKKSMN